MYDISKIFELYKKTYSVCIDSRQIKHGDIFFAINGENFDGNKYAEKALEMGASYAVIDNADYAKHNNCILVDDSLKCLQLLAKKYRESWQFPVLGITGTNGKTTTKELIACVLKEKYADKLLYTSGNFNNHIGVPLTILSAKPNIEFAIIEMGANSLNEIEELCQIAQPNYGIITNIGKAHLEGFKNIAGVINTKKALYHAVEKKNGTVFINNDDILLKNLAKGLIKISYGNNNNADYSATIEKSSLFVNLKLSNNKLINTQLSGNYNFTNIMAAYTCGRYFGMDDDIIIKALENYSPDNKRSQIIKTQNMNTIILDAYNANPTSMKLAIENIIGIDAPKKMLILGDMLELGEHSLSEHSAVIDMLDMHPELKVFLVGKEFEKANNNYIHFNNTTEAQIFFKEKQLFNYTILIKGSRGIKLEDIVYEF